MATIFTDDNINKALIEGLKEAFKLEMTSHLREVANAEIENIVDKMAKRIEIKLNETPHTMFTDDRQIKLELIYKAIQ